MRFRMSPFHVSRYLTALIFMSICSFAICILYASSGGSVSDIANNFLGLIFMLVLTFSCAIGIVLELRHLGFPWISFSETGIHVDWHLKVHATMNWSDCKEIGILLANFGSRRTGYLTWIYFSNRPLTYHQIRAKESIKFFRCRREELILIEYRPEVLEELLKYVPEERIFHLSLLDRNNALRALRS